MPPRPGAAWHGDRMRFDDDRLSDIFDKNGGDCTYCDKQLAWRNYGNPRARGAWEVDHSLPLSRGGTNHLNNLVPACTPCNQSKGTMTGAEFKRAVEPKQVTIEGPGWGWVAGGIAVAALLALAGRGGAGPKPPWGHQ